LDKIRALQAKGKQWTEYGGVHTYWDKARHLGVWMANIDTAFFHRTLEQSGLLRRTAHGCGDFRRVLEIGTGSGHLSAFLLRELSATLCLERLVATDIAPRALHCAKHNIGKFATAAAEGGALLEVMLASGLLLPVSEESFDLIVCNPPYIPLPPADQNVSLRDGEASLRELPMEPYAGTALLAELIRNAAARLSNRSGASLIINVSSVGWHDFTQYLTLYGAQWHVMCLGWPQRVPFKIRSMSLGWLQWLVQERGLARAAVPQAPWVEPHWHTLQLYRLTRRAAPP
jgi:tRNA1(Val) A37 N6-methylase TrmN6